MDYKTDKRINLYDDRESELFFNDLSDMNAFALNLESMLASGELTYDLSYNTPNLYMICMLNKFNQYYDALILFSLDERNKIDSLMVVTKNDIDGHSKTFTYSVGYYVQPTSRGKGNCRTIVTKSIEEIEEFFGCHGPHYSMGASSNFKYVLESIVSKSNASSNQIASSLLHGGTEVMSAKEWRTNEDSNIYKLELLNRFVC